MPPTMIPKSIATASMLAHLITAKFADGIPFYRHQKIFSRFGFELDDSVMGGWAIKAAQKCERLVGLLRRDLVSGPLLGIDETTVQVLREPGRPNTAKSYMWVFLGGPSGKLVLLFEYRSGRSADFLTGMLPGYSGVIQTDGYRSYDRPVREIGAGHAGWSHTRRNFHDAMVGKFEGAKTAIEMIGGLYHIESQAREKEITGDDLLEIRKRESARRRIQVLACGHGGEGDSEIPSGKGDQLCAE